jgi:hypothetical protein
MNIKIGYKVIITEDGLEGANVEKGDILRVTGVTGGYIATSKTKNGVNPYWIFSYPNRGLKVIKNNNNIIFVKREE